MPANLDGGGGGSGYSFGPSGGGSAPAGNHGGGGWLGDVGGWIGDVGHDIGAGAAQVGNLIEGAGKGLLHLGLHDLPVETWHNINDAYQNELDQLQALQHGDVGGFVKAGLGNAQQIEAGGKTSADLAAIAQKQGTHNILDPKVLEAYAKRAPVSSGLISSYKQTGTNVEQLTRAAGNTLTPGQPFGSDVGQLGSGAGLLGKTDYAKTVAKGGGGVLPMLAQDAANLSVVGKPIEAVLGQGLERAAAEKAASEGAASSLEQTVKTATKAAESDVNAASTQALKAAQDAQAARAAAAGSYDPAAAAQVAQADAAAQTASDALNQARARADQVAQQYGPDLDAARQAAEDAANAHKTAESHFKAMKLVNQFGAHVANSPFAIPQTALLGGEHIPGLLQGVGAAVGHIPGAAEAIDAAKAAIGQKVQDRRYVSAQRSQMERERLDARASQRRGFENEVNTLPATTKPVGRGPFGLFGHKDVPAQDPDVHAVVTMAQDQAVAQHMRNLVGRFGEDKAVQAIDETMPGRYTPEQLHLAAQVFGPDKAAEVGDRVRFPTVDEHGHDVVAEGTVAHVGRDGVVLHDEAGVPHAVAHADIQQIASPRVQAIRDAIPKAREAYEQGVLPQIEPRYAAMEGENLPGLRPAVTQSVLDQAEHNLHGTTPRVDNLDQWQSAVKRNEKATRAQQKVVAKAEKAFLKASKAAEGSNLSPAERANPRALFDRVMPPANEAAREFVAGGPDAHTHLANATEGGIAKIGRRLLSGKLTPDEAARELASQIPRLATRDPKTLSPQAAELVQMARDRGMGDVPRQFPNVEKATAPAQRLGVGTERAQAGAAQMARGEQALEPAYENLRGALGKADEPTRASTASVGVAGRAYGAAKSRLDALASRVAEARRAVAAGGEQARRQLEADASVPPGNIKVTKGQVTEAEKAVSEARKVARQEFRDDATNAQHELDDHVQGQALRSVPVRSERAHMEAEKGVKTDIVRTPRFRNIDQSGFDFQRLNEDRALRDWAERRGFISPDGMAWDEYRSHWPAGDELTVDQWFDHMEKIRAGETAGRASTETGWEPNPTDGRGHPLTDAKGRPIAKAGYDDAHAKVVRALADIIGQDAAEHVAEHNGVSFGNPKAIAETVAKYTEHAERADLVRQVGEAGATREARLEPGGDVAHALEADRQNEQARGTVGKREGRAALDAEGKKLYDRQVVSDQADIQGRVVEGKAAKLDEAASNVAERARTQGRTEGVGLGRAQSQFSAAERDYNTGEARQASGERITTAGPELAQEAATRVAGPIGQMYHEAGAKAADLADATRRYVKEQAALDKLDSDLAAKKIELERTVEAAPRRYRPVMQLGQDLKGTLDRWAAQADKDLGPGAGDVYRAASGEAIFPLAKLVQYGVDPQYLIGSGEDLGPAIREGKKTSGLPRVTKTGQRSAGIGLARADTLQELHDQQWARTDRIIRNETGERIIKAQGGKAYEVLGVDKNTPKATIVKALDEGKYVAVDKSLAPINPSEVTAESLVVRKGIVDEFNKFEKVKPHASWVDGLLRGYDKGTQALKTALRLSPRWQIAVTMGHSIMAMVGIGALPPTYFAHDIPLAIRLNKIANAGVITAEDHAWLDAHVSPQVRAALNERGGFLPGSIRNRGFHHEEFPTDEPTRAKLGGRGQAFQTTLDNMHRTAVWIHQLDRGLDKQGLADFRTAYPDMAHLSDTQIQNEAAIRLSIRTMGDYLNKTAAERGVLSRIIFFYPWLRHITKLALNTTIHNPLRVAWLLHLGAMFDPGPGPTDFLRGSFDAGLGRWVTPSAWNPFDALIPTSDNPLGSFNPVINTAIAATGFNPKTGKPVSRPSYEKGMLTPGEIANYAAGQVPLLKAAGQELPQAWGNKPVVRYATGQPIVSHGRFINSNEDQFPGTNTGVPDWLAPLEPLIGLPRQQKIDAASLEQAQASKLKKQQAQEAAYWRRVAAAGG